MPRGINPKTAFADGYFVVPVSKMINGLCFYDYQIAHMRDNEGYKGVWYDSQNSDENFNNYFVTVPAKSGDLYFTVESYYMYMVPSVCSTGTFTYTSGGV